MAVDNELNAFEYFRFKLGDIVLRVTDEESKDKGIVVARSLGQCAAGMSRGYTVAFDSVAGTSQDFEEFELRAWV